MRLGPGPWCGTQGGYTNHACRCGACRQAQAEKLREFRESHSGPGRWCGTEGGYTNHRCRCDPCTKAHAIASLDRAHRRRAFAPPVASPETVEGSAGGGTPTRPRHLTARTNERQT